LLLSPVFWICHHQFCNVARPLDPHPFIQPQWASSQCEHFCVLAPLVSLGSGWCVNLSSCFCSVHCVYLIMLTEFTLVQVQAVTLFPLIVSFIFT
jgi:hypothetical protein